MLFLASLVQVLDVCVGEESPDVSIEYAIPDPGQQSLDATQVIDVDGEQIVTDTSDDTEIGLMADEEQQELHSLLIDLS